MPLPEQVRKQAEQAKQFYDTPPPVEGEPSTPGTPPDPPAEPPVQGAEGQPPSPPPEGGGDGASEETYAQRWRSLQGSYNASMRRQSELEQQLGQMQALVATMTEARAATPPPAQQHEDFRLLTDDEASDYGEAVDVMRKVSREELVPLVQRIVEIERSLGDVTGRVVPQVQDIAVRQHQSAEQMFWGTLTQLVPGWREINEDPEFQGWLLETDPLTGSNRQTFLAHAQQALDARRVAQFFLQWRGGVAPPAPASGGNGASPSALELQIAPGRTRTSAPDARNQKTYTTTDIAKFFDEVRKGVYRGREEEKSRIERDIFSAQREGRIVG